MSTTACVLPSSVVAGMSHTGEVPVQRMGSVVVHHLLNAWERLCVWCQVVHVSLPVDRNVLDHVIVLDAKQLIATQPSGGFRIMNVPSGVPSNNFSAILPLDNNVDHLPPVLHLLLCICSSLANLEVSIGHQPPSALTHTQLPSALRLLYYKLVPFACHFFAGGLCLRSKWNAIFVSFWLVLPSMCDVINSERTSAHSLQRPAHLKDTVPEAGAPHQCSRANVWWTVERLKQ